MYKFKKNIIDITRTIGYDTIDYPGDTIHKVSEQMSIKKGDEWNVYKLEMTNHIGTHLDAPLHKYKNGKSLNDYPLNSFIINCNIIEIKNPKIITLKEIKKKKILKNSAVLFKTKNSSLNRKKFNPDYVYLGIDTAEYLVNKQVSIVGIDYLSIDSFTGEYPVHKILLSNGIMILEDVNLKKVKPGFYELICLPLKIKNANGAPVRAILIN